jgi:hypothetical protein
MECPVGRRGGHFFAKPNGFALQGLQMLGRVDWGNSCRERLVGLALRRVSRGVPGANCSTQVILRNGVRREALSIWQSAPSIRRQQSSRTYLAPATGRKTNAADVPINRLHPSQTLEKIGPGSLTNRLMPSAASLMPPVNATIKTRCKRREPGGITWRQRRIEDFGFLSIRNQWPFASTFE